MVIFLGLTGSGMLLTMPEVRPGWFPVALAVLFCGASLLSSLPASWFTLPDWRAGFPPSVHTLLGVSIVAMPFQLWFWWSLLAGTCLTGLVLLSNPLDGRRLALFLHAVASMVAIYAIISIVDAHSAWRYPFSGGAAFGLLPNRNHTATLLLVGGIVSFGLMQWELVHGRRSAATLAALCGAPALASLLFFSVSRAGVLCLVAGFILWLAGAPLTSVNRRRILAAVIVLAAVLGLLFVAGGSEVQGRLAKLWQQVLAVETEGNQPGAVDFRQSIFKDTAAMIADAPLTGVGLGHFEPVFVHYRQASLRTAQAYHPESDWLMVAAETGLPSVMVLIAAIAWFFARCWRARTAYDGLLRWTVAAAIGAALLHGIIDVPWHRPALGWFLFVLAMVCAPSSGLVPRCPWLLRASQVLVGLLLLTGAVYLAWESSTDRPPLGYRWAAYEAELQMLGARQLNDKGEFVAREAVRDFSLNPRAHLWRLGFLRTFLGTEELMYEAGKLAMYVDPVQPSIAAGVAAAWADIDPAQEAAARVEAMRRAARIDRVEGKPELPSAGEQLRVGVEAAKGRPDVQKMILEKLGGDPIMTAYWVRSADAELVSAWAAGLADPQGWLDAVPAGMREVVLGRWVTLPDPSVAVAYMEARSEPAPGAYWRQLASYYAKAGDKPRAVGIVAGAEGVALGGPLPEGAFARQLTELQGQGNDVAVRRLLKESVEAKEADPDKLRVAMAWYASTGDWEMAWKAASRLVTMRKNGQ